MALKSLKWSAYAMFRKLRAHSLVDWSKHKVVVFESDDWGLCAWMRDNIARERLTEKGYDVSGVEFKDTLETASELYDLYAVLEAHRDRLGRRAVFTPNYVLSNPDYDAIKKNKYKTYTGIPITKGFSQGWNEADKRRDLLKVWWEGIKRHVLSPEYHGLIHMSNQTWLEGLRAGDTKLRDFFEEQMFVSSKAYDIRSEYALKIDPSQHVPVSIQESLISEGKKIFYDAFGYYPHTAIAPHYLWDENTEVALYNQGIKYLQGTVYHNNRYYAMGEKHNFMTYLIRLIDLDYYGGENPECDFNHAFEQVNLAWKHGLPAIVSTHRLNYVGGIDPNMHISGINQLHRLLTEIERDFGTEVTYMSDFEVAQLLDKGCSIQQYGDNEYVCRNYIPNYHQKFNVDVPGDWTFDVINLNTERMVSIRKIAGKNGFKVSFIVPEGDYVICRT